MIEIKLQHHGSNTAVVLEGDNRQEITERFYSFWNHGATSGRLEWQSENRATFWANGDGKTIGREKILKAMEGAMLFKMLNDADQLREHDYDGWFHCCKGIKGGFMPQARIDARKWYDSLETLSGESRCIKINSLYEPYQEPFDTSQTAGFNFLQKQEHGTPDGDAAGRWNGAKSSLKK